MTSNRAWMYTERLTRNGRINPDFQYYINYFLDFAFKNAPNVQHSIKDGIEVLEVRCPCGKCKNRYFNTWITITNHLFRNGFMNNYLVWYAHGEFDRLVPIIKDSLPTGEKLPNNLYETKKMLKPLQLPSQRIHVCKNHCMLFWGQFAERDLTGVPSLGYSGTCVAPNVCPLGHR